MNREKIMLEKMPIVLENGKYYVFETFNKNKHIGVYDSVSNAMYVGLKDWCLKRDNITILAGPFTLEELVNMKRL